jgi:hypothetical protein
MEATPQIQYPDNVVSMAEYREKRGVNVETPPAQELAKQNISEIQTQYFAVSMAMLDALKADDYPLLDSLKSYQEQLRLAINIFNEDQTVDGFIGVFSSEVAKQIRDTAINRGSNCTIVEDLSGQQYLIGHGKVDSDGYHYMKHEGKQVRTTDLLEQLQLTDTVLVSCHAAEDPQLPQSTRVTLANTEQGETLSSHTEINTNHDNVIAFGSKNLPRVA